MSVHTLTQPNTQVSHSSARTELTYSISPALEPSFSLQQCADPASVGDFLAGENPLGCIRGVMWVMAFNAGVFLLGFLVWQSVKFLW